MFADIILPLNLSQVLTYGVPHELHDAIKPGMRVEVGLGRNKLYSGIVERLHNDKPEAYQVKPVKGIIDEEPVVSEQQLRFWRWITQYYLATPGEVMQAALPAHLKLMAETRLQWVAPADKVYAWSAEAQHAVNALMLRKELTISELRGVVGARHFAQVLNELLEAEAILINDHLEPAYKPKKEKIIALAPEHTGNAGLVALFAQLERAPRQQALVMAWSELNTKNGLVRQEDLLARTGATPAQVKLLADKGIFVIAEQQVDRITFSANKDEKDIVFTPAQQEAYQKLDEAFAEKKVTLLHGVTGSGKTLLYINKIKECVAAGRQAILMLPEIALTTQLVSRLSAYFGESLGVYHSHFSNNERVEIWEKVRKGDYRIVVGPRSALWLPYTDIGLIIADEEHDSSYKQKDPAPRFHARDAAIYLASLFDARVVLGSATPSVESLYNVRQGKYAYVPLKDRYMGVKLPEIEVINAKSLDAGRKQGVKLLTPELQMAMAEALQDQRQVILFQNRRGYAPFQMCTSCGWVPQCKNCAVSLTYHKSTDKMHCHYCGFRAAVAHNCPQCGGSKVVSRSFGTEKIEEEVQQLFPKARVARMDVDSMRGKNSMAALLDQLEKRKVDILVGTQMVVKGLDLAAVSLVGVLSADSLLSFPDFRVNERAFQLMEQVSGRAGRTDGQGRVLIQAYNVQHPVLEWVKAHDVQGFYSNEIRYREHFAYPPFSRLMKVIFKHAEEPKAVAAAQLMAQALHTLPDIIVQGPGPAIVSRVRNMYVHEIWIKCPRDNKILETVKAYLKVQKQVILSHRGHGNVQVIFDIDPV